MHHILTDGLPEFTCVRCSKLQSYEFMVASRSRQRGVRIRAVGGKEMKRDEISIAEGAVTAQLSACWKMLSINWLEIYGRP